MASHTTDAFAAQVRTSFPVFERRAADGRPFAFFDGPGGSQVPREVADAVATYLLLHNANTHGEFATSHETDRTITRARETMAAFLGAPSPREIVFGANMTTLTYHLSRALGREWGPGDELIVTELDHQANVAPWRQLAADRGMRVRTVPFDPHTLRLDYDELERLLSPRTRLVAVGAASNAVGTINDVARIAAAAREAGALTYVDAVHYAPHRLPDVQALGCDFLACSAYKFFGPHVGIVWGKSEHLERFTPYKVPPSSNTVPERWETGTLNHEGIAGAAAAVQWIASLDPRYASGEPLRDSLGRAMEAMEAHEDALFARLWDGLGDLPRVHRYGPPLGAPRTPTAAFTVEGHSPEEVARALASDGVFVWNGNFYASSVTEKLGVEDRGGMLRAGVAPYCSDENVERLLDGVRGLVR